MSRRKGWIVGIAVVIPLAGFLYYQVFLSRDVAKVGKEESGIESEAPETGSDYSLAYKTPCICGECTETLATCRCPTALEQIKRMGIIPEKLNR